MQPSHRSCLKPIEIVISMLKPFCCAVLVGYRIPCQSEINFENVDQGCRRDGVQQRHRVCDR